MDPEFINIDGRLHGIIAISVVCSFDAGGKRFYDPYPIEDVHNDRVPQNGKSARMNCTPNPELPTEGTLLTEWAFCKTKAATITGDGWRN